LLGFAAEIMVDLHQYLIRAGRTVSLEIRMKIS